MSAAGAPPAEPMVASSDTEFKELVIPVSAIRQFNLSTNKTQPLDLDDQPFSSDESSQTHGCEFKAKKYEKLRRRSFSVYPVFRSHEKRLREAAYLNNSKLIQTLLEKGTNPNSHDEQMRTPLHLAACRGYHEVVCLLLSFGANVRVRDMLGNTPLHLAVVSAPSKNYNRVIELLLSFGASVSAKEGTGKSVIELAESKLRMLRTRYPDPIPDIKAIMTDLFRITLSLFEKLLDEYNSLGSKIGMDHYLAKFNIKLFSKSDEIVGDDVDALLASIGQLKI